MGSSGKFSKPLLPYQGGNFERRRLIVSYFYFRYRVLYFLSAFGGALSPELEKDPSPSEIIYDKSRLLHDLYKVMQSRALRAKMHRVLKWLPGGSEEMFDEINETYADEERWNALPIHKRAAYFLFAMWTRYVGSLPDKRSFGTYRGSVWCSHTNRRARQSQRPTREELNAIGDRLEVVELPRGDAMDDLEAWLSQRNLFAYIDPPYYLSPRMYFEGRHLPFSWFVRLFNFLRNAVAKCLVSITLTPELEMLLEDDWVVVPLHSVFKTAHRGRTESNEVLILVNYGLKETDGAHVPTTLAEFGVEC